MGLFDFQSRKERRAAHEAHESELAALRCQFEAASLRNVQLARERDTARSERDKALRQVTDLEHVYKLSAQPSMHEEQLLYDVAKHCGVSQWLIDDQAPNVVAEVIKRSFDDRVGNSAWGARNRSSQREQRFVAELSQLRTRAAHAERLLKEIATHARAWDLRAFAELTNNVLKALGGEGARAETTTLRQLAIGTMERLTKRERKKVMNACGM